MSDRVSVALDGHVARVTLARPDKRNALDMQMVSEIIDAGNSVAASGARVATLAGEGESFCSGLDTALFAELAADGGRGAADLLIPRTRGDANDLQEACMVWRRAPMPVIASLHGAVFGAGLQLALGADIRIASPDARFALMEGRWGLVPDMGAMATLPKLMRDDAMRYMTYTAVPVDAARAEAWGLVTEIAEDPLAAAGALAAEIAARSPSAIREAKRLAELSASAGRAEALMAESRAQASLVGSPDQVEAVTAAVEGRAPEFG